MRLTSLMPAVAHSVHPRLALPLVCLFRALLPCAERPRPQRLRLLCAHAATTHHAEGNGSDGGQTQ